MASDHDATFLAIRKMLRAHAAGLTTTADTPSRFCLEAVPGPATLAAWGGRVRRATIPVAWVERGKAYVSYHLMGLDGSAAVVASLSSSVPISAFAARLASGDDPAAP